MTLDEAVQAAAHLLEERGQLLNGHLLRLVEGDKELFQDVRQRLIQLGLAEDCSGVGLAVKGTPENAAGKGVAGAVSQDIPAHMQSSPTGWWLMTSGAIRGPLDLAELCEMQRRGELKLADVVRNGTEGLWQRPDTIPELAASKPDVVQDLKSFRIRDRQRAEWQLYESNWGGGKRAFSGNIKVPVRDSASNTGAAASELHGPIAADRSVPDAQLQSHASNPVVAAQDDDVDAAQNPTDDRRFVPPSKIWSLENQKQPGWLGRSWNLLADLVGGSRRLSMILMTLAVVGAGAYWWQQPPPARTIYNEFTACRAAIMKLQDRRAKRSEWAPVVERYRPRIQNLVDRLSSRTTNPVQKQLYLAGSLGLLPLLENPMDPTKAERSFAQHIEAAQQFLDGNSAPAAKSDRPK